MIAFTKHFAAAMFFAAVCLIYGTVSNKPQWDCAVTALLLDPSEAIRCALLEWLFLAAVVMVACILGDLILGKLKPALTLSVILGKFGRRIRLTTN